MIESRFATASDVDRYYGARPHESMRAYIVLMNGEPMGIIGIAKQKRFVRLFSEFKPELREHLTCMTILRTIKKAMQLVKESRVPVIAVASPDEPKSRSIIERLGFRYHSASPNGEVYKWHG